ncbi:uncharacterized protein [Littorina saxatilis]|uniref:uncharacterized protein n=1 Tax=Littorina saxatilis TaxID=31220 RepID=UPI0038B468FD
MLMFLALTLASVASVRSACHPDTGPSGSYDCYSGRHYGNQPQWGTCVTNAYMIQKSKGRHQCRDQTRTYCYYQCMLELHDLGRGNVTSDCSCDPDAPMTTQPTPYDVTTLSPLCFSPNGTDCDWYRQCLEAKFQCSTGADDYGIAYGEAFCRLYEQRYNDVSPHAREWIDNVRKCLQVQLVPLLRPFEPLTCRDVKARAFDSHTGCYVTPFRHAPSVCELSLQDFWRVFWTIRTAFKSDFVESVLRLMEVRQDCNRLGVRQLDGEMRKLMIALSLPLPARRKRSAADTEHQLNKENEILPSDSDHMKAARSYHREKTIRSGPSKLTVPTGKKMVRQDTRFVSHADVQPYNTNARVPSDSDANKTERFDHRDTETSQLDHSGRKVHTQQGRFSYPEGTQARQKRETTFTEEGENSTELFYHQAAAKVSEELAKQLQWDEEHIMWFAYGVHLGEGVLQIHILMADEELGSAAKLNSSSEASRANLTSVLEQAVKAFEMGDVQLSVDGESALHPGVLNVCEDLNCNDVSINVTAPPLRITSDASLSTMNSLYMFAILFCCIAGL